MTKALKHILVDGMLSGTGIRDATDGGYVEASELQLPNELCLKIAQWQNSYEALHFTNYSDGEQVRVLDSQGMAFVREIRKFRPDLDVGYFSNAKMIEQLVS